jgi:citrate lyase subunit beta/citryl-CoA lyase
MKNNIAITGNTGPKVRSDCEVVLTVTSRRGLVIDLDSKVMALYGESITELVSSVLAFYEIRNAHVRITDSGALPFVITARLEAAVRKLVKTDREYLPSLLPQNLYSTSRDKCRFSRLYLPGNTPGLMINAGLHQAEGIILDLEDSVAPEKKDEARILVRNALRQIDFFGAERMVRINQGRRGLEDLRFVIPHNVNLVLIPKCESADSVTEVEQEIENLKRKFNISHQIHLMPIIESAAGVENAFVIARASERVVAMAIGLEDYTADLGVQRTAEGNESFYARARIVVAAKAAGIQPIDSVFSDVGDMEGLHANVRLSKSLGFEGMGCIHPRQIRIIRQGFAPDADEIDKALKIVQAFKDAGRNGLGVVTLGTKMIDPPVVARAQKTLDFAIRLGLLPEDQNPGDEYRNKDYN